MLSDAGIIRNRLKVNAAIVNAQKILELRMEHGSFKNWLEPDSRLPLLAIAGESGTGKSHLAARIIERLTYQYPQSIQHPSRVSVITSIEELPGSPNTFSACPSVTL